MFSVVHFALMQNEPKTAGMALRTACGTFTLYNLTYSKKKTREVF